MKVVIFALAVSFLGYFGLEPAAKTYGQLVAGFDLTQGRYEQLTYGLPIRWHQEYVRLLRERYRIEADAVRERD